MYGRLQTIFFLTN